MELCDRPSLSHRPRTGQPEPIARLLAPWFLQHRDQGWAAPTEGGCPCLG